MRAVVLGAALWLAGPAAGQRTMTSETMTPEAMTPGALLDRVEGRAMAVADRASGRPPGAERFVDDGRVVRRGAEGG